MRRFGIGLVLCLFSLGALADEAIWKQLREGGYVLLMRHAETVSGIGDPPGFSLDDCKTQRNLSDEGRAQARRTGDAFRKQGIALSEVRSSAWCRCVDTARLAFGKASVWPALNSAFNAPGERRQRTTEVLAGTRGIKAPHNLMLVTHQANIAALTGESAASGEIFVVKAPRDGDERLVLVGRLKVP
jgi:phosphohistidine phosphatase SixA